MFNFFPLSEWIHSALCIHWHTWHRTKHWSHYNFTRSPSLTLHKWFALSVFPFLENAAKWRNCSCLLVLCLLCSPRKRNTLRSKNLEVFAEILSSLYPRFRCWVLQLLAVFDHVVGKKKSQMRNATFARALRLMCEWYSLGLRKRGLLWVQQGLRQTKLGEAAL